MYITKLLSMWFLRIVLILKVFSSSFSEEEILLNIANKLRQKLSETNQKCGEKWIDEYSSLHKNLISSDRPQILVAVPHLSGMADRIVGFTTTFLIAILTSKAFQMGRRENLPLFEEAFTSPYINWTRELDPNWLMEPLQWKAIHRNYNKSILSSKKFWAINTIDNIKYQDRFINENLKNLMQKDVETVFMVSNRGKTIHLYDNQYHKDRLKQLGMNRHTTFGCLVNYLIQPKPDIFLPIIEQFNAMTDPDSEVLKISIQIRVGDHIWNSKKDPHLLINQVQPFFSCAKQIQNFAMKLKAYKSVIWYLATDSIALRRAAIQKFGMKIVTSLNSTIEHSAKETSVCNQNSKTNCKVSNLGFRSAAAEWWLLGYANYHVITKYSGYGRSGAYRNMISNGTIYTVHNAPIKCDNQSYSYLEDMMYDWSGI